MAKRKTTDAREPNAGTDFHVLWCVSKCLELLNFNEHGLKAIAIEGMDPGDEIETDPGGDSLLGVDYTEYFSGIKFEEALKVVICQVKYSTKFPNKEWTAFSICQGKKKTNGSIIHRLATAFVSIASVKGLDEVLKKTTIKLISNRPASPLLFTVAAEAKLILKNAGMATLAGLKKKLPPKDSLAVDRLFEASSLTGKSFIQFLSLLDFSDCNQGSRQIQKQGSLKILTALGSFDASDQLATLESLVRSKTVPEAKASNTITKEDLLHVFKFPNLDAMFPVPPRFETINHLVQRSQVPDIMKLIIAGPGKGVVCLDGSAGIGKSTIAKQLALKLPPDSVYVLFDCYGGGTYLDPDDKRHKHHNALLSICNEMALKTGSYFLITRNGDNEFYIREFSRRVKDAATLLQQRNKDAILAIIIDAADNSVTAAKEQHEDSFVTDMLQLKFPDNVRLILTSRTHRVASLQLPDDYIPYHITPFTSDETALYLTGYFNNVTSSQVTAFHNLTNGIPRVMSYAMDSKETTLDAKMKPLKPKGKNLEDLFRKLLKDAEIKSGDRALFKKSVRLMTVLPRPVPVTYLNRITGADTAFVTDIAADLSQGIIIEHDLVRFRDEDFETFLKDQYPAQDLDHAIIADVFFSLAGAEDYASTYLGRFLANADRFTELESIVLNRQFLKFPSDPVRNREVFIERARLAWMSR